jgi:hypothetical protein
MIRRCVLACSTGMRRVGGAALVVVDLHDLPVGPAKDEGPAAVGPDAMGVGAHRS